MEIIIYYDCEKIQLMLGLPKVVVAGVFGAFSHLYTSRLIYPTRNLFHANVFIVISCL